MGTVRVTPYRLMAVLAGYFRGYGGVNSSEDFEGAGASEKVEAPKRVNGILMDQPPQNNAGAPEALAGNEEDLFNTEEVFSSVLLIEDDPAHARLITRALRGIVGEITHVGTGREALESVSSSYTELVFCDLNLPDTTAFELIRTIRAVRPNLPIIVLTSSNSIDDAIKAMREGAWDYMVKQFSDNVRGRFQLLVARTAKRLQQIVADTQLRAERQALGAAAAVAQDGLGILGASGHIVFENHAFKNFRNCFAGEDKDLREFPLVDLLALQDFRVARALEQQLSSGKTDLMWSSEVRVQLQREGAEADRERFFELTLSSFNQGAIADAVVDPAQMAAFRQFVVWVRDITRRKEQERFQRDLLSTTTHDLKGPLGAIINSAELLTEMCEGRDGKFSELITRVSSCARNCITLIDELLSVRRIQDGMLVIKPRRDSLSQVFDDMVLDYLPTARSKSIDLRFRRMDPDVEVYADRIGLARVLGNLVSNALKFTPKGGTVELSAERSGSDVRISVTDTGPGIEAKDRHVLFEKYGRLDMHRGVEGTGLGLFVTKNIVDAHGGRIEVQSEVGHGTTFIVIFPDAPAAAAA